MMDPLCGSRLDPNNATVHQWAEHWGNFLLRELMLYPPSAHSHSDEPS
jgi:hypothetical protein